MLAHEVFKTMMGRLAERAAEIALFLESGQPFEEWLSWESYAACRMAGWSAELRPSYAEAGLLGSRDEGDLLVTDPARDRRVLVEVAVVSDWSTNRWIAPLNLDTANLGRGLSPGVEPLQVIILAASHTRIEVNRQWLGWLAMTSVWTRPTDLTQTIPLPNNGELVARGWVLGGATAATHRVRARAGD
jgi:hypothetical protein